MQQCYAQGVRTGINIPIHLADQLSIVSFFSDVALDRIRRLETRTARLFLLGHHIYSILEARRIERDRGTVHLSPRELECMRWVAAGKNATEIAQILGISVLTVRDYLKSVSLKLNTVSRAQALAKLLRMGYLDH
jgi:DNA-binding CsgD family transcriptional regulator